MWWFVIALFSAVLSAAAAIAEKKVLFQAGALEFSFLVSLLNMAFSLPFFLKVDFSAVTSTALLVLYLKTILGCIAFFCVMKAIKNLEISGALPLMVLTPGLVSLFAFIFLKESLAYIEISGMLLLLVGTYLLGMENGAQWWAPFRIFYRSKFHHYILLALFLFTTTSILDKALLRNFRLAPFAFMGFQQLFFAVNFGVIILVMQLKPVTLCKDLSKETWLWIVIIALLTVGYRYTQIEAVKMAPVALVLAVKRMSVFFAAVLGGHLLNERDLLRKTIATAIMVAGAVMIAED
jgi:uncharacterized membrane protein